LSGFGCVYQVLAPLTVDKSVPVAGRDKLDLSTPVDFVSTNDITGGNSGSPVINRDAEIVGLIFDGNEEAMAGDWTYSETAGRALSTDIRFALTVAREVHGAGWVVDELLKRGYIDEKKLGVTGGSGGGLLTNWTIGQTTRFAAAVAQRDIADWTTFWYVADFTLFHETWFRKPPFEDPEDYKARSPITYINNVKTPLMLILGEADWRTPTGAGGEEMFRALKYRKIPTVMIRFPNESHELSRSGQPWHRIERLQHIVGWFDKWLMGTPKPEYEVAQ